MPAEERDLFGYSIDKAATAARYAVKVHIDSLAAEAIVTTRHDFAAARRRLLGWQ